jgi:hypothetical protein
MAGVALFQATASHGGPGPGRRMPMATLAQWHSLAGWQWQAPPSPHCQCGARACLGGAFSVLPDARFLAVIPDYQAPGD